MTETVQQNLKGIRTIQSHGQEDREIRHFAGVIARHVAANRSLARRNAVLNATMQLGSGAMALVVAGVGGSQVLSGEMSIGTLAAFIVYLSTILGFIKNCSTPIFIFLNAGTAANRVFEILDTEAEIRSVPASGPTQAVRGEITVNRLSYSYPGGGRAALNDLSLTIRPGEMVSIIGPIGAGKSTLLRLLARQLEPSDGHIALDGHDLGNLPLRHLRSSLAFVTQDSFLFATSIAENISFDAPDRPEEAIWSAAGAAHLTETINGFEDGLSTLIGERGVTLSGGQKQRTSLARGLIRRTPVLLLDDSFSALDTETAASILSQLRSARRNLTTVVVSHRVSTARHADQIYVLEHGRITEAGNHEQLLARNGHYAGLLRLQAQKTEIAPA